jgi:hypothetical protein
MMEFMSSNRTAALLGAFLIQSIVSGGCSFESKSTPLAPAQNQIDVTGRWATDITVQGIAGRMTWTLTQTGSSAAGPVLVGMTSGTVLFNGFLTGTLTGQSFAYTITVGPGGIPNQPACTGQLGGTMTVKMGVPSTMVGPMSVVGSNCAIQLPGTSLTLTKP